jgi:hypothetical protein
MSKYSLKTSLLVALVLIVASAGAAFAAEGDTLVASGAASGALTAGSVAMTADMLLDPTPEPTATPDSSPTPEPTSTPTPTATPEPTESTDCHPVALLIGLAFGETCTDIEALHDSGIGFGVIGRAYLTAAASDGEVTAEELIELQQAGMGWGEVKKQYDIHPGGKGLGAIMSGRFTGVTPTPEPEEGEGDTTGAQLSSGNDDLKPGKGKPLGDGGWKPGNGNNPPGQSKDKNPKRKP